MQDLRNQLLEETEQLRGIAAQSGDPRLSALLVAVTDERASELLLSRAGGAYKYDGALLSPRENNLMDIVFSFSRPEGTFGILPLSLLVTVDLDQRRVVQVVDYYFPRQSDPYRSLKELRPDLDIRGLAFERSFDRSGGEGEVEAATADGDAEKKPKPKPQPTSAPPPKLDTWI